MGAGGGGNLIAVGRTLTEIDSIVKISTKDSVLSAMFEVFVTMFFGERGWCLSECGAYFFTRK